MIYYSAETRGFSSEESHGARRISIVDPTWVRPLLEDGTPDPDAVPPTIEIDNPNCKIPKDAVVISDADHKALTDGQKAGKMIQPDGNGRPMLVAPRPTATVKDVTVRIKGERDRRTQGGGYKVGAKWFHSDQFSRGQQLGLVLLGAGIPAGLQWKTMDGSFVAMTQALAGQILAASAAADNAIFAAAEAHIAAVQKAPDPTDYDFSSGWPSSFGDLDA